MLNMNRNQIIEYGKMKTNSIYQFKEIVPWKYLPWHTKLKLYIRYKPLDWFKKIKIRYGNEIMTFRNGRLIKTVKDEIVRGKRASLSVIDDWSGIDKEIVSEVLKEQISIK
jgi:hypothetical protein